jgi:hypothetical protein
MSATTDAHLGIIELGAICASMRARNIDLFEQLGAWVVDTDDHELQRLFALGSHLHAWHAELWAQRAPVIPPVELDTSVAHPPLPLVALGDRAGDYRAALDTMLEDLHQLSARIDVLLDPSTARTVGLVTNDLTDLWQRLDR